MPAHQKRGQHADHGRPRPAGINRSGRCDL